MLKKIFFAIILTLSWPNLFSMFTEEQLAINLSGIHNINLSGVHNYDKLKDLIKTIPRDITSLRVFCGSEILHCVWGFLSQEFPLLSSLDLSHSHLTGASLEALTQDGCHGLINLNLASCGLLTDLGMQSLRSNCPEITNLNLWECYGITDLGIQALTQGCHQLVNLNLSFCQKITDLSLEKLASGCPKLQNLKLQNCIQITFEGLITLILGCRELTKLDLSGCNQLNDEELRILEQMSSGLIIKKPNREIFVDDVPLSGCPY
ncbi:MAG: hypothetical protein WC436_04060 [Candidatus Babeliales bacterium]